MRRKRGTMKRVVTMFLAVITAISTLFIADVNKVYATEVSNPCSIKVSVDDVMGVYEGTVDVYVRTPNGDQILTFDNKTWGVGKAQSFVTEDFGQGFAFGKFSVEGYELVLENLKPIEAFEITAGGSINLKLAILPTSNNTEYGEWAELLKNGSSTLSQILQLIGVGSNNDDLSVEPNNATTTSSSFAGQNFDFDSWYAEAKPAYDKFVELSNTALQSGTWTGLYNQCDLIYRNAFAKAYSDYVHGKTEDDFKALSVENIFIYVETYLRFGDMVTSGGSQFKNYFENGQTGLNKYFSMVEGLWAGEGKDELVEVYENLMQYQIDYYNYYHFPYNFVTDKSYSEETGLTYQPEESVNENGFTESEQAEIDEVTKKEGGIAKESKETWSPVFKTLLNHWLSLLLLVIAFVGLVIVRIIIKKKNVDDMSEDGK